MRPVLYTPLGKENAGRTSTFSEGKASVELPGATPNAEPVKKEIKVGLSDGISVEVADGLKENDLVVERPPKKIE